MFNLIKDRWIPVRTADGGLRVIRPDQIGEVGVVQPAWERPDLNLACYEFLVGLVYLAGPPLNTADWNKRKSADAEKLRAQFSELELAFELNGGHYRFLQDTEDLVCEANPVDMLFIDSAGASTVKKCSDLFVKYQRYKELSLPLAAMALYAFQSQAPAGGAGNRTSMRGGGPLITLVEPAEKSKTPLWDVVWANVPDGVSIKKNELHSALPWMRPTVTSKKGETVHPSTQFPIPAEAFFGMPRRLRLDFSDDGQPTVTGVRQRPSGTNYGLWKHPLSPYYSQKPGAELLPAHPRPGASTYRNWEGVSLSRSEGLRQVADCVSTWRKRSNAASNLIVGGWSMDKMTPRDFQFSRQPLFPFDDEAEDFAIDLVEAANAFSLALAGAIQTATNTNEMGASQVEVCRDEFYSRTQEQFEGFVGRVAAGDKQEKIAQQWCKQTRAVALKIFETLIMPGLYRRSIEDVEKIVEAHGRLRAAFEGYGPKTGKAAFEILCLPLPKPRKKKERVA